MVTGSLGSSSGRRLEDKTTSPPLVLSWLHVGRGRPFVAPAHRGPSSCSSVRPAGAPLWHRVAFHPGAVALLSQDGGQRRGRRVPLGCPTVAFYARKSVPDE